VFVLEEEVLNLANLTVGSSQSVAFKFAGVTQHNVPFDTLLAHWKLGRLTAGRNLSLSARRRLARAADKKTRDSPALKNSGLNLTFKRKETYLNENT
jgi:hypothetical protein